MVQGARGTEQISQTPPHPPTRCKIIGLLVGHTHMASAETVLEHSRRCIIISNMPRSSTAKNFTPPNETERRGDDTGRIRMMNSPPRSWTRRRRASAWCSCAIDPSWCRSGAGAAGTSPWKPSWPTSFASFELWLLFVRFADRRDARPAEKCSGSHLRNFILLFASTVNNRQPSTPAKV